MFLHRFTFICAESIMLACFGLLSAYMLRESSVSLEAPFNLAFLPGYGASETAAAIMIGLGVYWLLQITTSPQSVFWVMAIPGLLAQGPSIMAHNVLDWSYFVVDGTLFSTDMSTFRTGALFLLSLVILVSLHRIIELRDLRTVLQSSHVDSSDVDRLILSKILALGGIIVSSLLLSATIIYVAGVIGGGDQFFGFSSWTTLIVGGGAIVFVGVFPLLWVLHHRET